MKALIYVRVSKEEQNPNNQIMELKEFCKKQGWEIYDVLVDRDSGLNGREKRENFNRVFELANKRKYDVLLIWALDRFTREGVSKTLMYLKQLDEYGVSFKSYQEIYLDTTGMFKDIIIALLATMANFESKRKSERIKSGLRKSNKKPGRMPLSGDKVNRIKEMRKRGNSIREIAKEIQIDKNTVLKYCKQ